MVEIELTVSAVIAVIEPSVPLKNCGACVVVAPGAVTWVTTDQEGTAKATAGLSISNSVVHNAAKEDNRRKRVVISWCLSIVK